MPYPAVTCPLHHLRVRLGSAPMGGRDVSGQRKRVSVAHGVGVDESYGGEEGGEVGTASRIVRVGR